MRPQPDAACGLCPRLRAFRMAQQAAEPTWFNAPVPSFGASAARLLVVGLAPGVRGANRTGRPFTGDFAGEILYPALLRHGLAAGDFAARIDDGLSLPDCRITNAVRCVPPANRPLPAEIANCRSFLSAELGGDSAPSIVLALGRIAHDTVLRAHGLKLKAYPFRHGAEHHLPGGQTLLSSFHTSRYNINTGLLTTAMFDTVVRRAAELLRVPARAEAGVS